MDMLFAGRPDLPPPEPDLPVPGDPVKPDIYPDPMPDPQPVPPQDPELPPPGRITPPVRASGQLSARLPGLGCRPASFCDGFVKRPCKLEDLVWNRV